MAFSRSTILELGPLLPTPPPSAPRGTALLFSGRGGASAGAVVCGGGAGCAGAAAEAGPLENPAAAAAV